MDLEQRAKIKMYVELGKSAVETYKMIEKAYGKDECMSRTQVSSWYKRFKDGRTDINDNPKSGRPSIAINDELINKVRTKMASDPTTTMRMMASEFDVSLGTIHRITNKLKTEKEAK